MNKTMPFTLFILLSTSITHASDKAIYGNINMQFISSNTQSTVAQLSKGVAYISPRIYHFEQGNGRTLIAGYSLREGVNLCSDEKFSHHISRSGSCTGFLIAPDILLTAGHCISTPSTCENMNIAFGVTQNKETQSGFLISNQDVYRCSKVLKYSNEPVSDYSIVKLDRKVKNRHIFSLGNDELMKKGSQAFMIGHPMGLAQIHSGAAPVVNSNDPHFLKITLDSFGGNSGGPVIDAKTNKVIGLLIRGASDFQTKPGKNCSNFAKYPEDGYGEWVYRINQVKTILKNYQIL